MSEKRIDPTSGQFIDPLFAVIIAAALAETILPWAKRTEFPSLLDVATVALGFINLLLSWFGYHKSVIRRPIKGSLRFIVTVVLLPAYLLTIVMYESGALFISSSYFFVFALWHFWEWMKSVEYPEVDFGLIANWFRAYNVLVSLALMISLLDHYSLLPTENYSDGLLNVTCLALIAVAILWLRTAKSLKRGDGAIHGIASAIVFALFGRKIGASDDEKDQPEESA